MRLGNITLVVAAVTLSISSFGYAADELSPLSGEVGPAVKVPIASKQTPQPQPMVAGGLYGTDGFNLYLINKTTGTAQLLGAHGIGSTRLGSIAFRFTSGMSEPEMYGLSIGGGSTLYRIDPTNGAATRVGSTLFRFIFEGGLASDSNGILYGVDEGDADHARTFTINHQTGEGSIISSGTQPRDINGLTFDGSMMYAIDRVTDTLGAVSTVDGLYRSIGPTGVTVGDVGGLAIDPATNILYANFEGTFYSLDKQTGAATYIAINNVDYGLEFAPLTSTTPSWTDMYTALFANLQDVDVLRKYRDTVLVRSPLGKQFKDRLYELSDEALQVLVKNPELIPQAQSLLAANRSAVHDILAGKPGVLRDRAKIAGFLESYAEKAPKELRTLAMRVHDELQREGSETFLGFQLAD